MVDLTGASPLVVTGAARGIGLAVARLASAAGARVILLDRDRQALEPAVEELGGHALALGCDVSDEASVTQAFETAARELGAIRGLVTCAGIDRGGALHELDLQTWDAVLDVNLRGTFLCARAALPQMLEAGSGAIVCVSSPFALAASPGTGAYAASKGGVSALVRALAVEYAPRGIRVNAILPGPTETTLMWAAVDDDQVPAARARVEDEVPLRRLADPGEPAQAALWLLSNAASYVTGSQLACDGGVLAKASISL
jgi:NAD(P)-dependent dehydrogenase (short-subunit alcohol dehydrogenase family)